MYPDSTFTFKDIGGMSYRETAESKGLNEASPFHPPLARTPNEGLNTIMIALASWDGNGMTRLFWFTSPPVKIESGSLTEMTTVCLRIRQSA